ncbi:hypothetical protein [Rhodospirillum sp. A1_3_36]|uniref:hypothetical protein n=1 Tax=Rhodospirillum sp. A1_3_36 TaxID=3391666 RepID=UPI0039A547CE
MSQFTRGDFIHAVRNGANRFKALQDYKPAARARNGGGVDLLTYNGNNGIVFKAYNPKSKSYFALKCFDDSSESLISSYREIANYIEKSQKSYFVDFSLHERELVVSAAGKNFECPVLRMEWVEAPTLGERLKVLCQANDIAAIATIRDSWITVCLDLVEQNVAHGDISDDNVLISDGGRVSLIDYDGMYVASLAGRKSPTLGHTHFNHPMRSIDHFDQSIDDFSMLLVSVGLSALAVQPSLLQEFEGAEKLLFEKKDFLDPDHSPVFDRLRNLESSRLNLALKVMADSCRSTRIAIAELSWALRILSDSNAADLKVDFWQGTPRTPVDEERQDARQEKKEPVKTPEPIKAGVPDQVRIFWPPDRRNVAIVGAALLLLAAGLRIAASPAWDQEGEEGTVSTPVITDEDATSPSVGGVAPLPGKPDKPYGNKKPSHEVQLPDSQEKIPLPSIVNYKIAQSSQGKSIIFIDESGIQHNLGVRFSFDTKMTEIQYHDNCECVSFIAKDKRYNVVYLWSYRKNILHFRAYDKTEKKIILSNTEMTRVEVGVLMVVGRKLK